MRVHAVGVLLCLALLSAPASLLAAPEDVAPEKPKSEKWVVVTGDGSGRLVWTAFSQSEMDPDRQSAAPSLELDPMYLAMIINLGIPLVTDDVISCDLQTQEISPAMLGKGQDIELLHYLTKHFRNAAGNSNFELQVNCPLPLLLKPKKISYYIDKPIAFSLKSKTKTGFGRMVRLSNLVAQNVTQIRIRAFAEKGVAVPGVLLKSATPKDLADYWNQFILAPMGVECNSVVYDETLSCLIIDVKKNNDGYSLGDLAGSH